MSRLQDRVALVTGAASGMGRASATLFAAEGAKVVAFDKIDSVEETAAAIRQAGGVAVAMTGDAGLEADVAAAVDRAMSEFGGLDACYANAGVIGGFAPFFEETPEQWTEVLRINLIGVYLAIKHAAKVMRPAGKGSIICLMSDCHEPCPPVARRHGICAACVDIGPAVLSGIHIRVQRTHGRRTAYVDEA